jgi:cytochrome bd-type quinol oxidase subunit 2
MDAAQREKSRRALIVIAPLVIALVAIWIIYDPLHLISSNPETAEGGFTHIPAWLWLIGVGVLGLALAYGISQNRKRAGAGAKTNVTQDATRDLYRREERNRERKDLP